MFTFDLCGVKRFSPFWFNQLRGGDRTASFPPDREKNPGTEVLSDITPDSLDSEALGLMERFSALEARVPPPLLLLALAAIVWALPGAAHLSLLPAIGAPVILLGLAINAWPKALLRRAGTTVNPLHPERSSALITTGLYRYSRNPMYLGYAMALLGWVAWQGKPFGLAAVVFFIAYVTRFQILPEERQLLARFPAEYAAYKGSVRRWA